MTGEERFADKLIDLTVKLKKFMPDVEAENFCDEIAQMMRDFIVYNKIKAILEKE